MENKEKDEFDEKLEELKREVEACQESRNINSCFVCENLFTCTLRKAYLDAAYNSMSKGKSGGFDF